MTTTETQWLPLDLAAEQLGYTTEGLRRRLRQLRTLGYVEDTGRPPKAYAKLKCKQVKRIVLMWPNITDVLMRSDAPSELLNPNKGRRRPIGNF